jgi:hypothetical protein
MFCDPNEVFSSQCPPLVITSNSFVVDFHYPPPIITQCCSSIANVDQKGKKLVDEDVVIVIEYLQLIAKLPTLETQVFKKRNYNSIRKFQESWVAKLPWAKMCLGSNGCLHIVKCKIHNQVEGKDKLLATKWDSFCKHADYMKAHRDMGFVKKGD